MPTGVARQAEVAGDDVGRMGDPRFRAFAERAMRAILDAALRQSAAAEQRLGQGQRPDVPVHARDDGQLAFDRDHDATCLQANRARRGRQRHDPHPESFRRPARPDRRRCRAARRRARSGAAQPALAARQAAAGQSAVIDVNRARTEPIPIAIPDLGGPDGASAQLGHDIAGVISDDLARSGLFRLIDQAGVHPGRRERPPARRTSRTGSRPARRRWSPAACRSGRRPGAGRVPAVGHPAADPDPGHRLHHHAGQLAPHRPHHGRRDLRAAAGREGLFRYPHRLHLGHRPARPAHQAPGHHGPGQREQPPADRWLLAGADAALPSDARRDRVHELRQQPPAGLSVRPDIRPAERCWATSPA